MGNQCEPPCIQTLAVERQSIMESNFIKSGSQFYDVQVPTSDTFFTSFLTYNHSKSGFWPNNNIKLKKNFKMNRYFYGNWINGLPQGRGILYEPNKILVDSYFRFGEPYGYSKIVFINKNSEYDGEVQCGKLSGNGTLVDNNRMYCFKGAWNNSQPQNGTLTFTKDKNIEKIDFLDFNKRQAKIYYRDGRVYQGEVNWSSLAPQGKGKVKFATFDVKDSYEGQWSNGIYHGPGTFVWKNGQLYHGDYKQGRKDGYGRFKFITGNEYVGDWANGKQNGFGVVYDQNGHKIKQGEWKAGTFIGPDRFHLGVQRQNSHVSFSQSPSIQRINEEFINENLEGIVSYFMQDSPVKKTKSFGHREVKMSQLKRNYQN